MTDRSLTGRGRAAAEFRRMLGWIALIGLATVAGALFYLSANDLFILPVVLAVIGGVFVSILLGCGLFSLAFFSDKSGHDQSVSDATIGKPPSA